MTSERDLCEQYGVSRITVRKALSELVHEDLIYASVGKGTYLEMIARWNRARMQALLDLGIELYIKLIFCESTDF